MNALKSRVRIKFETASSAKDGDQSLIHGLGTGNDRGNVEGLKVDLEQDCCDPVSEPVEKLLGQRGKLNAVLEKLVARNKCHRFYEHGCSYAAHKQNENHHDVCAEPSSLLISGRNLDETCCFDLCDRKER